MALKLLGYPKGTGSSIAIFSVVISGLAKLWSLGNQRLNGFTEGMADGTENCQLQVGNIRMGLGLGKWSIFIVKLVFEGALEGII